MSTMIDDREPADTLDLADWRRRVADLYAEVRRLSTTDVGAALKLWRTTREALYREHPSSPLPPARRAHFRATHFDHDPTLRFVVAVATDPRQRDDSAQPIAIGSQPTGAIDLPVSGGGAM